MIDTITLEFWVNPVAENYKHHLDLDFETTDFQRFQGFYRKTFGCRLSNSPEFGKYYCRLTGSLSKFLVGDNLVPFTFDEVEHACKQIASDFEVSLDQIMINRIDLSANVNCSIDSFTFLSSLISLPRKRTTAYKTGKKFESKQEVLVIYDKYSEIHERNTKPNMKLRETYQSKLEEYGFNQNETIIRTEYRALRRRKVKEIFGCDASLGNLLYNGGFTNLTQHFLKLLRQIKTLSSTASASSPKSLKQLILYSLSRLLNKEQLEQLRIQLKLFVKQERLDYQVCNRFVNNYLNQLSFIDLKGCDEIIPQIEQEIKALSP